tara:strand:- start:67 stop:219 length:153 start_codon:yes stop_codon:yes gene_type:complete
LKCNWREFEEKKNVNNERWVGGGGKNWREEWFCGVERIEWYVWVNWCLSW